MVANWELVPIEFLRVVVVTIGTMAGVIPIVVLLDPGFATLSPGALLAAGAWSERLANVIELHPERLILILIAWLVISTATFLFSCFLRGGTFGTLVGADRQALPGSGRPRAWFRTFSGSDFRGWGGRLWGRYFWLANLDALVIMLLLALTAGMAIAVEWAYEGGKSALAGGVGCAAVLVLVVVLVGSRIWVAVARADAGREESTVGGAAMKALALLGNRFGALFLLVVVIAALAFALLVCFFALNVSLARLVGGDLLAQGMTTLAQAIVEVAAFALLSLWFNGSVVALARAEAPVAEER